MYRLEIINLMPNGDFEDTSVSTGSLSTSATAAWWIDDSSGQGTASIIDTGNVVAGARSLAFELLPEDAVRFPLTSLTDGLVVPQAYSLRFGFYAIEAVPYLFTIFDNTSVEPRTEWEATAATKEIIYRFPNDFQNVTTIFASETDFDEFRISGNLQKGSIDDVRIVPSGILLALRCELPLSDSTRPAGLDLVPGTYRFTMYVRNDPSTALNRYPAVGVTIRMSARFAGSEVVFLEAEATAGSWDAWTLLTVTMNNANISAPDDPEEPVLEISVTPGDDASTGARDTGSILISHPTLEHLPNE